MTLSYDINKYDNKINNNKHNFIITNVTYLI